MTTLTRWVLWVTWLAGTGWGWSSGALGTGSAIGAVVCSLLLFVWSASSSRRRSSVLRYVEVGKQPIGLS